MGNGRLCTAWGQGHWLLFATIGVSFTIKKQREADPNGALSLESLLFLPWHVFSMEGVAISVPPHLPQNEVDLLNVSEIEVSINVGIK